MVKIFNMARIFLRLFLGTLTLLAANYGICQSMLDYKIDLTSDNGSNLNVIYDTSEYRENCFYIQMTEMFEWGTQRSRTVWVDNSQDDNTHMVYFESWHPNGMKGCETFFNVDRWKEDTGFCSLLKLKSIDTLYCSHVFSGSRLDSIIIATEHGVDSTIYIIEHFSNSRCSWHSNGTIKEICKGYTQHGVLKEYLKLDGSIEMAGSYLYSQMNGEWVINHTHQVFNMGKALQ